MSGVTLILFENEEQYRSAETRQIATADLVGVEQPDDKVRIVKHRHGRAGVVTLREFTRLARGEEI